MMTPDVQTENTQGLFFGPEERAKWDDYLTPALCAARRRISEQRVSPSLNIDCFRQELKEFDFLSPRSLAGLLPVMHHVHRRALVPPCLV
jgi:hypothetical protein